MKKTISIALLGSFILIAACTEESKTISTGEINSVEPKNQQEVQYGSPVIIKGTDFALYPLKLNESDDSDSYKREAVNNYWNMIFYNTLSGKSELLTKERLVINSFNIGNSENRSNNKNNLSDQFIYYSVTDSDNDGDKKLTTKDPHKFYISKLDGTAFTRITPYNYHLSNWKIDDQHNLIFIDLIKDSNGDKKFNEADEVEYFVYNLKTEAFKVVFDQGLKDEVKNLAKKIF
ncbi:hypothetical protein [Pedobacter sp. UBA5917]|jgi:hypothetical protein|uniref:hypothetical protein n=1 Tax=Pedobacter sp. UBA5917 TaxID=1947061 RepID=UPI0025D67259|nr:hypothetical protein [Pedobacter sp. UBA5917]